MKWILLLFLALLTIDSLGQKQISGVVKSAENGQGISGASVFLNNTSTGTVTSTNGEFTLHLPAGRYELVISSIGYKTQVQTITSTDVSGFYTISMQREIKEMQAVVIEPYEQDGWAKWGQFFLNNFIGSSSMAKDCKITNWNTIRFRHAKKRNELTAHAAEPLIIENHYLGYTVQYQLESFSYDLKSHLVTHTGYPLFIPMKGNEAKERKWKKRREETYHGSMMHFMRSLYRNSLNEEGFEMRRLVKVENEEKKKLKAQLQSTRNGTNSNGNFYISGPQVFSLNPVLNEEYKKVMQQPDFFDVVSDSLLVADSIAFAFNATTAGLEFRDYLQVRYKHKSAHTEYIKAFPRNAPEILSQLHLINGQPIEIHSNGMYYNPIELISMGYWSWSEKISTMLPFDYWPWKQ